MSTARSQEGVKKAPGRGGKSKTARRHGDARSPALRERVLGPHLPQVLHSPGHDTLDPIILDIIALIYREHVLTWYSSISRDPDRDFVKQVSSLLIHVIQALEVRLARVNLVDVLVVELPALLQRHVHDWDQATARASTGVAHNQTREQVFHHLQPHIAVMLTDDKSTTQAHVDKVYLRALVDNVLKLLLPPEDYRSDTERTIIREIVSNIILGNLFSRTAQPWFLHAVIARTLDSSRRGIPSANLPNEPRPTSLSERSLAYWSSLAKAASATCSTVSAIYVAVAAVEVPPDNASNACILDPSFVLLLTLLPNSFVLSQFVQYATLFVTLCSSFVTSLVYHVVRTRILTLETTRTMLETAMRSLFPNGHPPPKEPDPTPEEQQELAARCERLLADSLPAALCKLVILSEVEDRPLALARHLLRPISSHVANVHLFVLLLDLAVAKLFPELLSSH